MQQSPIPDNCYNCLNYHGRNYHGNILVCGIHPSGQEKCLDWVQGEEHPRYGEESKKLKEQYAQAIRTRILRGGW